MRVRDLIHQLVALNAPKAEVRVNHNDCDAWDCCETDSIVVAERNPSGAYLRLVEPHTIVAIIEIPEVE